MEKRIEAIESNITQIKDDVKIIAVNSAVQNEQLKEHMRRTAAVEEQNDLLRNLVDKRLTPVEQFVDRAKFLGMVFMTVVAVLTCLGRLGFIHL